MADEGEREPEFEAILDALDPNRDGFVTLQEYMAYMISKETDKVKYMVKTSGDPEIQYLIFVNPCFFR